MVQPDCSNQQRAAVHLRPARSYQDSAESGLSYHRGQRAEEAEKEVNPTNSREKYIKYAGMRELINAVIDEMDSK